MRFLFLFYIFLASFFGYGQQDSISNSETQLVNDIIKAEASNNPQLKFSQFEYESYENLKITGDPEAITGPGYKKTELRKTIKQTQVFYAEKTSNYIYSDQYGLKEQITAADMPGFNEPVYPIYNINFQSSSAYQSPYIIFDNKYINPVSMQGLNNYLYAKGADSLINGREVVKLNFMPIKENNPAALEGQLFIDKETLAIARAVYTTTGDLNVQAIHNFEYQDELDIWFNTERFLSIKKEKDKKELELFGARFQVGIEKTDKKKTTNEDLYVFLKAINYNFTDNLKTEYGRRGLTKEVLDEAIKKPAEYWEPYRTRSNNTDDEFASYKNIDSVVVATNITKKLETLDKFKVGYYPVGFFDIDLKYLIKYNNYEAFRLGIGGTTNEKLSEHYRLGGYVAYGTKDRKLKYNVNAGYRLNKEKNTWLNVYHTDDINEFAAESFLTDARVYSLFEPRLVNIPTFYLYREYGLSLQERLVPSVISEVSLSRKRIDQTTPYIFQLGDTSYSDYVLTELKLGVRWSPYSEFMRTPNGYEESIKGFPVLSAQLTKGFSDVIDSDFNYVKVSAKASYTRLHSNKSSTEFSLEGHYASGEVPLTHLFHAYPNAPNKDRVLQRFSVAGRRSFETMYFNEFFSDKIAVGQVKHEFAPFIIAPYLQPELVLITRYALGDLDDQQQHLNIEFDTLDKGYLESGFELNKLIYGFGLSAAYRYGAYHLPQFEDNLSIKFTFYLEL
ncbi:hypothetical protein SAMN05192588_2009 [Nonlabens sp. Hel1_33_55]|uniref:DUF5686 family protein n=1 Tax=Nonlabens sp. Hel1_33_55 TaxID=1336802 RepID=UPI000875BE23|nr:DUF5686 family protein [Nonlabens sp. Hel1_33_55]SCY27742.1 hypothetical protein SAMN05192588_2009 [Nonlabens sp. Hel1_33_55]